MYIYIDFVCTCVCTKPRSAELQADSLLSEPQGKPYIYHIYDIYIYIYVDVCVCVCVCVYVYVCLAATGLIAVYRIFCCGVWASPVLVRELRSVVSRASCLVDRPGIKPTSCALQGRFLTIRPPDLYSLFMKGKAKVVFNWKKRFQGNTSLF